jgi:hypothetical protein
MHVMWPGKHARVILASCTTCCGEGLVAAATPVIHSWLAPSFTCSGPATRRKRSPSVCEVPGARVTEVGGTHGVALAHSFSAQALLWSRSSWWPSNPKPVTVCEQVAQPAGQG